MANDQEPIETHTSPTMAQVRVGTSGYSFEDWRGSFYPEKIARGKMLDQYVLHFDTVEINSTYYRIPHPAVMHNIVKKAPEGFDFMIKAPQSFTHRRTELQLMMPGMCRAAVALDQVAPPRLSLSSSSR